MAFDDDISLVDRAIEINSRFTRRQSFLNVLNDFFTHFRFAGNFLIVQIYKALTSFSFKEQDLIN